MYTFSDLSFTDVAFNDSCPNGTHENPCKNKTSNATCLPDNNGEFRCLCLPDDFHKDDKCVPSR